MRTGFNSIFALMLGALTVNAAQRPMFGGTFIAAVIGEDGIVIAADSRSTFIDSNNREVGFIDGMPKVFVQQGTAIAVAGLSSMDGELLTSFIRQKSFLLARPVDEILPGVALYLPYRNTNGVAMLAAGFLDGLPRICAYTPSQPNRCMSAGFFANKESGMLREWAAKLGHIPKMYEAAAIMRQTIQSYAASDRTVGGSISMLHLRNGAPPAWLEGPPPDNGWTKICDIVRDHRSGRIRISAATAQADLESFLAATCPR